MAKHFTKGKLTCIEGRLQRRSWTDKNNQTRYSYEVVASSVYFAGFNRDKSQAGDDSGFDPFATEAAQV